MCPFSLDDPGEMFLKAAEDGCVNTVIQLLEVNPDLISYRDIDGYSALHRACAEDNVEVAAVLLAKNIGTEIDACSDENWTPLHSACHWNAFRCVRLLLENGANISSQTKGGIVFHFQIPK